MTEEQMQIVAQARTTVVRKFRHKEGGWDRPDSAGDPWYKPEEWDDDGNYYGPAKAMMPVPVRTDESIVTDETTDTLLDDVRTMLGDGLSIKETAENLGISRGQVQRLKAKLKISD